mgnify:CR=1 FL=1
MVGKGRGRWDCGIYLGRNNILREKPSTFTTNHLNKTKPKLTWSEH